MSTTPKETNDDLFSRRWHLKILSGIFGLLFVLYILLKLFL